MRMASSAWWVNDHSDGHHDCQPMSTTSWRGVGTVFVLSLYRSGWTMVENRDPQNQKTRRNT